MQIPILLDPLESGGFRARAGEPFGLTAEEAARNLAAELGERLRAGSRLHVLEVGNGSAAALRGCPGSYPAITYKRR